MKLTKDELSILLIALTQYINHDVKDRFHTTQELEDLKDLGDRIQTYVLTD